jgi:hypothetical protein
MKHMIGSVLAGVLFALLLTSTSFAQSTFGSITGNVTDPSGSTIAAADVVVTNQGTGTIRRAKTDSVGLFVVPNLDLGTYQVRISAQGFVSYGRGDLVLQANQIISLDVHLTLGKTSEVVEVKAASPIIATETNDLSVSMTGSAAVALPFVSRYPGDYGVYGYSTLATGTSTQATNSSDSPVINGVRCDSGLQATMDGIAVTAWSFGASVVQMSMDMVQEVKMETAVAPAEFPTAGNVMVVSRSGTNALHGQMFEVYNGNALNARDFFSATVPFRVYNNFGASAGGRIIKNKLFFFGDYQGSRESATSPETETVPTAAMRQGNFSSLSTQLTNPLTGQPYTGNMVPVSSYAQAIQNYIYPLPNSGAAGVIANDYNVNELANTGFSDYNRFDARGDYYLSSRDVVYARVSWMRLPYYLTNAYPIQTFEWRYGEDAVLSYNHTISPTAMNEFRFGSTYQRIHAYNINMSGTALLSQFGITGVPTTSAFPTGPEFAISPMTTWNPNSLSDNPDKSLEAMDNFTWSRGRHTMKFGMDYIRERYDGESIGSSTYGVYNFTGAYTGYGYADFLIGIPATTQLAIPTPPRHFRGNTWGMYAQDQFRFNKKLTLNYGIRWEIPSTYSDARGEMYNYDPKTGGLVVPNNGLAMVNKFYPANIPIITASAAGYPANSLINTYHKSIYPRVGFAYKLNDQTVVRGGYGIYTNIINNVLSSTLAGGPFSGSQSFNNSITNYVPAFSFPSPFLPAGTTATQSVTGANPNMKTPYTQQWNLTVERQVGSLGLRASYVGSRSVQLLYGVNLNEPPPSTTPFSTKLYPNQLFSGITYYSNGGFESYNALELLAERKIGKNLTFSSGFTWGKDLTDAQDANGAGGNAFSGQVLQNQFCLACEKSNGENEAPRRLYGFAVYQLPVGRGQHYLTAATGVAQGFLGGWQASWTGVLQPGQYFSPSFSTFDPSNTGVIGGVPDRVAGAPLYPAHQTVTNWFNANAFAVPGCPSTDPMCTNKADFVAPGRFGNSGFNILTGPPERTIDMAMSKSFPLSDRFTFKFFVQMADILNHPIFRIPPTSVNTPSTVGVINSTGKAFLADPRVRTTYFSLYLMF